MNSVMVNQMLNAIVPISRFNKGEANKIFDEVNASGYKIVVKNNKPACVLVAPEKYEEMMEIIENHSLFTEAEKRMKNAKESDFISEADVLADIGITKADLVDVEVEIE